MLLFLIGQPIQSGAQPISCTYVLFREPRLVQDDLNVFWKDEDDEEEEGADSRQDSHDVFSYLDGWDHRL